MKTTLWIGLLAATLTPQLAGQNHTHGTMVGSLRPSTAVVWTRASAAARVSVLYNRSPSPTNAAETTPVLVAAGNDFTAHVKITGLLPGVKYYYTTRIANPSNQSQNVLDSWGSFTTPPAAAANTKLTFLASGDVKDHVDFGIFTEMAKHNAAFYLNLGDMPYADGSTSQADFWKHYKDTRNHANWIGFLRNHPIVPIWDDHEVTNDWDKATPSNLVNWGKKAFFDYWPYEKGSTKLYRTVRWGKAAEIWLLDCRAYRDANATPSTSSKTMLGATQKAWLKSTLKASNAAFKILCSTVPVRYGKMGPDDWSGYAAEREEILDYIRQNNIPNVVILSGDSHLLSVHNLPEGIREYQTGPLAAATRPQVAGAPEVRFRASVRNFVKFAIDSTVTPAKLTVSYFDGSNKKLYEDSLLAESPAKVRMQTDLPHGEATLTGNHFFTQRGDSESNRVPPGNYHIEFAPDPGSREVPSSIDVTIPPGSDVAISGRWDRLPTTKVLFADSFDKVLSGYTVVDETTVGGPSSWRTSGGELLQTTRIGGPVGGHDSDRPGTMLITGTATWTDYTTITRFKSHDRSRLGVVFRYRDKNNYYRFILDDARAVMRLERKLAGSFTTLAERKTPYVAHNYYDVRCVANGAQLEVYVAGERLFQVTDTSHPAGKVGLYTWQNRYTTFSDLTVIQSRHVRTPVDELVLDHFANGTLTAWEVQDQATKSGASNWIEQVGVLMQLNTIGDDSSGNAIAKPGTVCLSRAVFQNDFSFSADMLTYDEDAIGLVFRFKDASNHYRFSWNRRLRERQLQKVVGGTWSVLWSDNRDFDLQRWYRARIQAEGSRLRLWLDGELLADVTDTSHGSGQIGLYSWKSSPVFFDNVFVSKPRVPAPTLVAVTQQRVTKLHGRSAADGNLAYGIALSFARTPSIPVAWLTPADPRYIEIAPDLLFQMSIRTSPMFQKFFGVMNSKGEFTATINWPPLPSLKGIKVYAAGWTDNITQRPIKNVIPTVEIIFP